MTPELTALTLAGLLRALRFNLVAVPANRKIGPDWAAGPRDTPHRPLSPSAGSLVPLLLPTADAHARRRAAAFPLCRPSGDRAP